MRESLLDRLSQTIGARMGLHYPRERWRDLERGIAAAAPAFGVESAEACARWLISAELTQRHIETLAHFLTIGETYFFREKRSFEILEEHILPQLLRSREGRQKRLRIWSAACATGEEAYSIAILLSRLIPDLDTWNVSILATDIDPGFLDRARRGVYGEWSFRDAPAGFKSTYFRETADKRYEIDPRIREMVTFEYLNLVEDTYPSVANGTNAVDLVFCRNVLIYFEASRVHQVLQKLSHALVENGWLFLNPVEIPHARLQHLEPVTFADVTIHRKNGTLVAAAADAAPPPRAAAADSARALPGTHRPATATLVRRERAIRTDARATPARRRPRMSAPTPSPYEDAAASYRGGRYAETVEKLLEILSKSPDDAEAMALLVRAFADQGRLSDARAWCEKAVEKDRLNATSSYLLATILAEQGLAGDAATALKRAVYLDPEHALAHFALGNLARRAGNAKDAARHYRNALSVLSAFPQSEVLPESEGITAGRLAEIIRSTTVGGARP
jgi:chemotaxis protein methyltransferase CheR